MSVTLILLLCCRLRSFVYLVLVLVLILLLVLVLAVVLVLVLVLALVLAVVSDVYPAIKENVSINLCGNVGTNNYVIRDEKHCVLQNLNKIVFHKLCFKHKPCKKSYIYKCHGKIDKIIFDSFIFLIYVMLLYT